MFLSIEWWWFGVIMLCVATVLPLAALTKDRRSFRRASLMLTMAALAELSLFAVKTVATNRTLAASFVELAPNIALTFQFDRLAGFFLLIITLIGLTVAIYSLHYIEHEHSAIKKNLHVALMNGFILSMMLVVASANTIAFLVFWELMSICSFFLVMFHYEEAETKKAGQFYFIMTQLSTVFLMFAFLGIHALTGSFDIAAIGNVPAPLLPVILFALFVGFSIKAGIIPAHKWLPYAHPASPSNISALMSGVMLKVAAYGLLRFAFAAANRPLWFGILLLVTGTISAILGGLYALKELDIKRMLAYHSIENIGIVFIGLGLSVIFEHAGLTALKQLSLAATWFHALNHALYKSLLFLTAGSVAHATGTRNMEKMGGLVKIMPYTAIIFLIGSVAISALPPLNGFASELMIFQAMFAAGELPNPFLHILLMACLAIFALTSALASACFVRAFGAAFLALPRSEEAARAHEVEAGMILGPALAACCCAALGVFSAQLFGWFGVPMPIPNLLFVAVVILLMLAGIVFALKQKGVAQSSRVTETWGCGLIEQTSRMEYTASGFSEPILTIFDTIYGTKKEASKSYFDWFDAYFRKGSAKITTAQFHEEYLYQPIADVFMKLSGFLTRIQSSVEPDAYILVLFLTSLALIFIGGVIIL